MEIHKEFAEWAVARGVKINGVAAHRFPGKGLGIIAEKQFKARMTFLIPTSFAFTALLFISISLWKLSKLFLHLHRRILSRMFLSEAGDDG